MRGEKPQCSAAGCRERARTHTIQGQPGMCPPHEKRFRKYGDPYAQSENPYGDGYTDTGCDLEPSCLRCSLPRCRYD